MILSIVRHARALPEDEAVDDAQRQVTRGGAKQFAAVLQRYKDADELDPHVIFCGPETRNMQTAELARDFFGLETTDVLQDKNLGPAGDPKEALAAIQRWVQGNADDGDPDGKNLEVMAIGSNPAIAGLFELVHGLGTDAGSSGSVKLKKGSVAKLKVYGLNGDDDEQSSELRSYLPPGLARGEK